MYFPYLRGRQYELLALRELVENDLMSNRIIPVIEPIKPTSTLTKTLRAFVEKGNRIAFIENPQVGNYKEELRILKNDTIKYELNDIFNNRNVIYSHILNGNSRKELDFAFNAEFNKDKILVINYNSDYIDIYNEKFADNKPLFNLVPDEPTFRREVTGNKVLLADRFLKQSRNSDYLKNTDHSFSVDHRYYQDEGYVGFSDYSIVGSEFSESGFAPMAVAIHIVYFKNDSLRIKHFVSDSNNDISDPAGKFYEALKKLIEWHQANEMENTLAIKQFKRHYNKGTYPGLGSLKKFSVMHHIELVSKYLDGELK